jgi:hypothetical protein
MQFFVLQVDIRALQSTVSEATFESSAAFSSCRLATLFHNLSSSSSSSVFRLGPDTLLLLQTVSFTHAFAISVYISATWLFMNVIKGLKTSLFQTSGKIITLQL